MATAKLIGIYSSCPGSGKSTVATMLAGEGFVIRPFAYTLKRMLRLCLEDLGLSQQGIAYAMGSAKNEPLDVLGGKTPRHAMQQLGTDWGRNSIDSMLWVNAWRSRVSEALLAGGGAVADDLRFLSEAQTIRWMGGMTVKIIRPGHEVSQAVTAHASEGGLELWDFDATIINDGSLEDLQAKAWQLLGELTHVR